MRSRALALGTAQFLMLGFSLLPTLTLLLASLVPDAESGAGLRLVLLARPTVANHANAIALLLRNDSGDGHDVREYLLNTAIVATVATIAAGAVAIMAGMLATRFGFRFGKLLQYAALGGYAVPPLVLVVPYALIVKVAHVTSALVALIAAHVAFALPLAIWLAIQYFDGVAREWDTTAYVDGLSCTRAFARVLLPQAWAGVATILVFTAILSWNDVLFALLLTADDSKTISVGLQDAILSDSVTTDSSLAAAVIWVSLPLLAVVLAVEALVARHLASDAGVTG